jgi:hypothetical protein
MKTIEIYEQTETEILKLLLKEYEEKSESNEILMDEYKSESKIYENIKRINNDYEIDIRLIRMELTKRLWCGTFEDRNIL